MARIRRRLAGIGAADLPDDVAFDAYIGPAREVTVDPVREIIALHDGVTPGGNQFNRTGTINALFDSDLDKSPAEKAVARENIGLSYADEPAKAAFRTNLGLPPPDPGEMAAGTETAPRAMSPADARAGVEALAIGVGQTWQVVSRTAGTSYQNTTGKPITVAIIPAVATPGNFEVSPDNATYLSLGSIIISGTDIRQGIWLIPPGYYYRLSAGAHTWRELR